MDANKNIDNKCCTMKKDSCGGKIINIILRGVKGLLNDCQQVVLTPKKEGRQMQGVSHGIPTCDLEYKTSHRTQNDEDSHVSILKTCRSRKAMT